MLKVPIGKFKKTDVYRNLSLSEDELVESKAHTIAEFLLSEAGLDLSAYTSFAQTTLPRMLHALLDEVYGDRR